MRTLSCLLHALMAYDQHAWCRGAVHAQTAAMRASADDADPHEPAFGAPRMHCSASREKFYARQHTCLTLLHRADRGCATTCWKGVFSGSEAPRKLLFACTHGHARLARRHLRLLGEVQPDVVHIAGGGAPVTRIDADTAQASACMAATAEYQAPKRSPRMVPGSCVSSCEALSCTAQQRYLEGRGRRGSRASGSLPRPRARHGGRSNAESRRHDVDSVCKRALYSSTTSTNFSPPFRACFTWPPPRG